MSDVSVYLGRQRGGGFPDQKNAHALHFELASFPGSSAPERNIELVHVERAWFFFSHVSTLKGRKAVERS